MNHLIHVFRQNLVRFLGISFWCTAIISFAVIISGCENSNLKENSVVESFTLPYKDFPNHESGIALLTFDWARRNRTELGTEYLVRSNSTVEVSKSIIRNGLNSALRIDYKNTVEPSDFIELLISGFKAISSNELLPNEIREQVTGVKFKIVALGQSVNLMCEAIANDGTVIDKKNFTVEQTEMTEFSILFDASTFKYLSFKILHENQKSGYDGLLETSIIIDDIYFINGDDSAFMPPSNDDEFLNWLQRSAIRFFIWNYCDLGNERGFVLGSTEWYNTLSIGGQAFGMAAFILAEKEGMLTPPESKRRIVSILNWMHDQDWYSGKDGWKGFPHHWFNADGTPGFSGYGTSTVDWAIAAAGIRVVRQYYKDDNEISSLATELLSRPNWNEVFDDDGYIAMGINIQTGEINPWRWGISFTEEAELTYLEARSSNQFDNSIFEPIVRDKSLGFFSGWWSTGFEFNWMQLWTGPIEPFKSNSVIAYNNDASTCLNAFGRPIMGLTAVGITKEIDNDGFAEIQYYGDQGSIPCRSNDSKQIAPAPYGAALALPFTPDLAIKGLREFVELGYYHPLIGFPGSVRLKAIGDGGPKMIPNWSTGDLELGPFAIAIDQYRSNIINQLYQDDPDVKIAIKELIESIK